MSSRVKKRQSIIMHLKTIRYFLFIEFSFSLSLSLFLLWQLSVKRNGQVSGLRVINYTIQHRRGKMLN